MAGVYPRGSEDMKTRLFKNTDVFAPSGPLVSDAPLPFHAGVAPPLWTREQRRRGGGEMEAALSTEGQASTLEAGPHQSLRDYRPLSVTMALCGQGSLCVRVCERMCVCVCMCVCICVCVCVRTVLSGSQSSRRIQQHRTPPPR